MKTKLTTLLCLCVFLLQAMVFAGSNPVVVNEKLIKAFHDAFPLAEKVDWQEKGDSYFVYFIENEVRSQIEYDHDGQFVSATRYYQNPNLMPLQLSWELHKRFADKTIYGITETTSGSRTLYFIKLEGQKDWTTVKANGRGSMHVVEKLQKQA